MKCYYFWGNCYVVVRCYILIKWLLVVNVSGVRVGEFRKKKFCLMLIIYRKCKIRKIKYRDIGYIKLSMFSLVLYGFFFKVDFVGFYYLIFIIFRVGGKVYIFKYDVGVCI